MQNDDLTKMRNYKIIKANELIQKSRFNLHVQEQKIILYLISKIKPEDINLQEQIFQIRDFCKICGLDCDNGANYRHIKQTLKNLRDKSVWIENDTEELTLSWFDYVKINKNNGAVTIKISDMMKPYLLHLNEKYTQYELLYTLAMKSSYSLRLYEILKSYEYQSTRIFTVDELRKLLFAENYSRFADFKRRVLDVAIEEINTVSDISVSYGIIKDGRKYAKIDFTMKIKKKMPERIMTWKNIDEVINPVNKKTKETVLKEKSRESKKAEETKIEKVEEVETDKKIENTQVTAEINETELKTIDDKKKFSFLNFFSRKNTKN